MKSRYLTFTEAEASAAVYHGFVQFFGFDGERHVYSRPSYLVCQMKRRHWLLAPEEVGKGAMEEWLSIARAEWGTGGQADKRMDAWMDKRMDGWTDGRIE